MRAGGFSIPPMQPLLWTYDVRVHERKERERLWILFALFIGFAVPEFLLMARGPSVKAGMIGYGAPIAPIDALTFWLTSGLVMGIDIVLGVWVFAQLARWGEARQLRRTLERAAQPPPSGSAIAGSIPATPPRWP